MINKKRTTFIQHLEHENETQDFEKFIEETAPLIGYIVQSFNALEQSLNNAICNLFHSGTDEIGLLVIQNMPYVSKVELFGRFYKSIHLAKGTTQKNLTPLLNNLKKCAELRNAVVHADWDSTDYEGYTFVRVHHSTNGIEQEYFQFTVEALTKIDEFIDITEDELWKYEDEQD